MAGRNMGLFGCASNYRALDASDMGRRGGYRSSVLSIGIELPSTRQLMIWVRRASRVRFMTHLVLDVVCSMIYIPRCAVNGSAYMDFKRATDALFDRVDHADLARALGVSIPLIRQARLDSAAAAYRSPPEGWEKAVIRLARERAERLSSLAERLKKGL
jgi:hypothetical protein